MSDYTASKPNAQRVRSLLARFAQEDVARAAEKSGEFDALIEMLTTAEDALDDGCDMAPSMAFCDWLEERQLVPEATHGLRVVLNDMLENPRPDGTRLLI